MGEVCFIYSMSGPRGRISEQELTDGELVKCGSEGESFELIQHLEGNELDERAHLNKEMRLYLYANATLHWMTHDHDLKLGEMAHL